MWKAAPRRSRGFDDQPSRGALEERVALRVAAVNVGEVGCTAANRDGERQRDSREA